MQNEITEAMIEAAARAMCEAWHYAPIGTPDGDAEWRGKQDQYRKQARAAISAALAQAAEQQKPVAIVTAFYEDDGTMDVEVLPSMAEKADIRVGTRLYTRPSPSEAVEARRLEDLIRKLDIARSALIDIAHTCTEDSHGNTKDYPVSYYKGAARAARASILEE